jgi:hypothetical protein
VKELGFIYTFIWNGMAIILKEREIKINHDCTLTEDVWFNLGLFIKIIPQLKKILDIIILLLKLSLKKLCKKMFKEKLNAC